VAHCPPELLDDLTGLFADLRTWPGMVEKSRGVFYVRHRPFLHFHQQVDGRRRADVKGPTGWIAFDLPHPLSAARRRAFLGALRAHHARTARAEINTRAARTR
jgi:hypothetical protein